MCSLFLLSWKIPCGGFSLELFSNGDELLDILYIFCVNVYVRLKMQYYIFWSWLIFQFLLVSIFSILFSFKCYALVKIW